MNTGPIDLLPFMCLFAKRYPESYLNRETSLPGKPVYKQVLQVQDTQGSLRKNQLRLSKRSSSDGI